MALVNLLFGLLVLTDARIVLRDQHAAPKLSSPLNSPLHSMLSKPAPKDPKPPPKAAKLPPMKPPPKKEIVADDDDLQKLNAISPDVTYCYGDADCDRGQYCSSQWICKDEPTNCYDDVECPGIQICDESLYECVDPTPSPTTSGCCAGDYEVASAYCNSKESASECSRISQCYWIETDDLSQCDWSTPTEGVYEPGCCTIADTSDLTVLWMEKCTLYGSMYDCLLPSDEYGTSRCQWTAAPDDFDCTQIWPTPPPESGCCAGTSGVTTPRCIEEEESMRCERMSDCHWISGEDADCEWMTTAKPYEPGCCQIIYDTPINEETGWSELCRTFWNEEECTSPRSSEDYARCYWTPTEGDYDCSALWPTTTAESEGCCAGDSMQSSDRCMNTEEKNLCDRMSDCHWISGEYADCSPPSTTEESGCCYVSDASYLGTRWEVICVEMWTQSDCLRWTDTYGHKCQWTPQSQSYDCSLLWPTPPPPVEGCCASDNAWAVELCTSTEEMINCQRMANCHWVETADPSDCEYDDDGQEYDPGCCTTSPYEDDNYWNQQCRTYWNMVDCATPKTEENQNRCVWTPTDNGYDCDSTTTTTETPTIVTVITPEPTTTTTTPSPIGVYTPSPIDIVTTPSPVGVYTPPPVDTPSPIDTPSPTTTASPTTDIPTVSPTTTTSAGCCAPDDYASAPMCVNEDDRVRCDRMSSCHWIDTEDPTECVPPTTTAGPGCCLMFDQRPKAYEEGWMGKCAELWTEKDCLRPMTSDDYNRCYWVPTEEYIDCEQFWPSEQPTISPTAPAPGCCASTAEYAVDSCTAAIDEETCIELNPCYWIETVDYDDCIFVVPTTEEPEETTEAPTPGCCVVNIDDDSDYNNIWISQCSMFNDERTCTALTDDDGDLRCNWVPTTDDNYDCSLLWPTTSTTTTTSAPGCCAGDSASYSSNCNGKLSETECGKTSSCHWIETSDPDDCTWQTTEEVNHPGCCMIAGDDPDFSNRWIYKCIALWSEYECLMPIDDYGDAHCQWIETPDEFDCSELWPTEPPPPGCCASYSPNAYDRCIGTAAKGDCDRMSDCHWIQTEDTSQCDKPETTTDEPPPPGCCQVVSTYSDGDGGSYSSGWIERCREYWTQETCESQMDSNSDNYTPMCFWTETTNDYDCSLLWPTTTMQSPPGCCAATIQYAVDRCAENNENEDECQRYSDCYWIDGEDANCEWVTTSTSPPDPGCCYVVSYELMGTRWESICKDMYTENNCYTFKDEEGVPYCQWMGAPEDYDCSNIWPTPTPAVGCCAATALYAVDRCLERETLLECQRMSDCYWNEGEYADCTFEGTTTTPPQPGCCMIADGSSMNNPWIEKCTEFWTESDCVNPTSDGYTARCQWTPTPEDFDCSGIWPTMQPTEEPAPGCCAADSQWATDRCNETEEKIECDRMSSCHWIETLDNSECDWLTTNDPVDPGCCYVEDPSYLDTKWQDLCTAFWTEERCLSASVCHWEPTDDYVICDNLYPTLPPSTSNYYEPGCCAGDNAAAAILCGVRTTEEMCDRYSMCHWRSGEDADCEWRTTEPVTEPGCCTLNTYSDSTDLWTAKCMTFWNEKDCTQPEDPSGVERCIWTPTTGYADCESLVTTTEDPEPGCCGGIDAKTNEQCGAMSTKTLCERKSSCYWNSGSDADCSWPSTTPGPYVPGCCVLANSDNLGTRWEVLCTEFYAEFDCLKPIDADYINRCEWIETPSNYDCKHLWPTRAPEGCCAGDSYLSTDECGAVEDRNHCERMSSCYWIETLDPTDCQWDTTETPGDPGCCYIASAGDLESEYEEECNSIWNEGDCHLVKDGYGTNKCQWTSTSHYFDCSLLWPTPVPEPGCCSGGVQCADIEESLCERMSNCHWIHTEDLSECENDDDYGYDPGCCDVAGYFNPMNGWTSICRNYWNEEECNGPVGSDGIARCKWTPTEDSIDCESTWSTPAPEPGCCAGDAYGSTANCNTKVDMTSCERISSCHWVYGEYADCTWITTTEEPGCCAGDSALSADKCAEKESEVICNRASICHWLSGEDADCEWGPGYDDHDPGCCTVSDVKNPQSYLWEDRCTELWNAKDCLDPLDDHSNARCQWTATDGEYDCSSLDSWPTTAEPEEPGCCILDESQKTDGVWATNCPLFWNERDCLISMDKNYQYRCSWIPTDYDIDCTQLNPTPSPVDVYPVPGPVMTPSPVDVIPYPVQTPSPVDPYPINTPSPVDPYPIATPSPIDTPSPVDPYPINPEPTKFPTHLTPAPTPKPDGNRDDDDGCCAADCQDELALCNAIDDGDKCQKLSSCHWKPGKKADCSWKTNDEPQDPGCCVAKSDQVDSEWFTKCPQFWNEEKCDKKDKNCKWVDCQEEEDCTKYWPTTAAQTQAELAGHAELQLVVDPELVNVHDTESGINLDLNGSLNVSMITVIMMMIAALAMYAMYRWWTMRYHHYHGDGYEKLGDYKWEQQTTSHLMYDSM